MQTSERPPESGATSGLDRSVRTLLSDVEEFLNYIAIVKTPEVDAVRTALERSLDVAKRQLLDGAARAQKNAADGMAAHSFLANPWMAVAAAVLLGVWVGTALRAPEEIRRHSVR